MKKLKVLLDELVKKYETSDFIKNDPIQFPHRYTNKQDIEISGLIASALAYGKREMFIKKLEYIHSILGDSPHDFCMNFNKQKCAEYFSNFRYRFNCGEDIIFLLEKLNRIYKNHCSLDDVLLNNLQSESISAKQATKLLSELLCSQINSKSYCYLFPNPLANSACKRLNLFLKWMVRKSPVDLGIWQSIKAKDLIIPLDVHVAKVSRNLGLTTRKANDWQTAEEITARLREFDADDPVKYDYALFDIGIEKIVL